MKQAPYANGLHQYVHQFYGNLQEKEKVQTDV